MDENTPGRHEDSQKPKRGPGEGTIDRLKSGKVRVRMVTAEGRQSATFATEEDAERFRAGAAAIMEEAR